MTRPTLLATLLLLGATPAWADTVVVTAARMVDVLAGHEVEHVQVVVQDGRIASVGHQGDPAPQGARHVDLGGRTLLDHALDRLLAAGVTRAVVNTHWQADLVQRHLAAGQLLPALIALEGMLLIAPDVMANWLDAAELNRGLGRHASATSCLERVLASAPGSEAARIARTRLDGWNGAAG